MIPHNLPEALRAKVTAEIAERTRQLGTGMAADYPDYRERVGTIRGLLLLNEYLTELTEDDETTQRRERLNNRKE